MFTRVDMYVDFLFHTKFAILVVTWPTKEVDAMIFYGVWKKHCTGSFSFSTDEH